MNSFNFSPQDGLKISISKMNKHMLSNNLHLKFTPYIVQLQNGKEFFDCDGNTYKPVEFNWFTNIDDNSVSIINKTNIKENWNLKTLLNDIWNGKYKFKQATNFRETDKW